MNFDNVGDNEHLLVHLITEGILPPREYYYRIRKYKDGSFKFVGETMLLHCIYCEICNEC